MGLRSVTNTKRWQNIEFGQRFTLRIGIRRNGMSGDIPPGLNGFDKLQSNIA